MSQGRSQIFILQRAIKAEEFQQAFGVAALTSMLLTLAEHVARMATSMLSTRTPPTFQTEPLRYAWQRVQ